ncbi:MAG: tRNA lysidine(34) synthetase TilS [Syntrophaceae bacterium]
MFDAFMRTLTGPCSVRQGDSVLVCVSGGLDSMVLLHLMLRASCLLDLRVGVVHVDHGIRKDASKADAQFVLDACRDLAIEAHLCELSMGPSTPNLEEEARRRRYHAVMECARRRGYLHAATGHTLDDQAETILYRIIRGTGIRGLAGIAYAGPGGLIRPMLDITRAQVTAFAVKEGITHVEDTSNHDVRLSRNLIRHRVLPVMERINPRAAQAVVRFAEIAREEGALLEDMTRVLKKKALLFDWGLITAFRLADVREAPDAVTRRLIIDVVTSMIREPRGIDSVQVDAALGILKGRARAHTIGRKVRVQTDGETFVFRSALMGPYYRATFDGPGRVRVPEIGRSVHVAMPVPEGTPLTLRSYLRGDRIRGRRVSEVLARMGVMSSLRPFWPVLISGNEIVAVAARPEDADAPVRVMITGEDHG